MHFHRQLQKTITPTSYTESLYGSILHSQKVVSWSAENAREWKQEWRGRRSARRGHADKPRGAARMAREGACARIGVVLGGRLIWLVCCGTDAQERVAAVSELACDRRVLGESVSKKSGVRGGAFSAETLLCVLFAQCVHALVLLLMYRTSDTNGRADSGDTIRRGAEALKVFKQLSAQRPTTLRVVPTPKLPFRAPTLRKQAPQQPPNDLRHGESGVTIAPPEQRNGGSNYQHGVVDLTHSSEAAVSFPTNQPSGPYNSLVRCCSY